MALAAHRLVCDAAEAHPLALIVDDAHGLHRSSLGVLSFIVRRVETEAVALIAAIRDGYVTPLQEARLPTLHLRRLSPAAAEALLDRAPDLSPIARARVLAQASGNPLALVELARVLPASIGAQDGPLPTPATLTARLEQAFAARLDELSGQPRFVLLAAALDGGASLAEVAEAAGAVHGAPVELAQLDAAVEADLVEVVDAGVRFRHPLKRSAVRQAAPPAQVLQMHAVLAAVVADPERRLWHRAMAAVGPDEELAAALEAHAAAARRRGAAAAAAAALERAATLTPEPVRKGERPVRAAEVAYELGLVETVRRLLQQVEAAEIGPLETARSAWLQHMISGDVWVQRGAVKAFVAISREIHDGGDTEMALRSPVPIAPLVAADDEAERLFRVALREDRTGYPLLRAGTLFSFGCWLRRQRRSAESRKPRREAIDLFDALGATRWTMRARQELRATGETIGHRTPVARDRLTAQELQIASLAARGLSNREIGERLFLSHRTIGSHLYRIFPKL